MQRVRGDSPAETPRLLYVLLVREPALPVPGGSTWENEDQHRRRDAPAHMRGAKSEWPEFWDAELAQLSADATTLLGDDAVSDAIERALLRRRLARHRIASFDEMKEALKDELRRIARPQ